MTLLEAVRVFKATQPQLEAIRDVERSNKAARKVLGEHMQAKELDTYRGISLSVTSFETWDDAALRAHLGDRVSEFRTKRPRKHFGLVGRRR